MPSDRSRLSDRPRRLYSGIVAQQGRVLLDRDVNELEDIVLSRLATDVREIVGPSGTPDDGFRISPPNTTPSPGFFSPPEPATSSPPEVLGGGDDFLIGAGSMYLGGHRVEFPSRQDDQAVSYSYLDQPDWPLPVQIAGDLAHELIYLDAVLQEVSAVEDPDLLEVALGGPDTSQRLRFIPRVKRETVDASDCATAWEQAIGKWTALGLTFDPATMRLSPAAKLQVTFTEDASTGDPCDPTATGGYLGADNQLIRAQVSAPDGTPPTLVWGYDNASFIYRITSVSPDATTLTLASDPPDAVHTPQAGQIVEILTTGSVIAAEPDETDPAGVKRIVRVAAEAVGEFHGLAQPYGPITQGDPTSYIVLSDPVGAAIAASALPLFLRVWQAQLPLTIDAPLTLFDPNTQISTGLEVTLSGAKALADGAYWEIAARPSTPQAVYPEDLLTAPRAADGPFRLVCPLAVIDWTAKGGPSITDCRNTFDNLVNLSRRRPGCCVVSISPRDVTATADLQALIDRAAATAERVTVCLAPGIYPLAMPLRLGAAHAGIIIESCGGPAILQVDTAADAKAFIAGLVTVAGVAGVSLVGLTLNPPPAPATATFSRLLVDQLANATDRAQAASLLLNPHIAFGVHAFDAPALTVERCTIVFVGDDTLAKDDVLGAAIFLQGDCRGFRALDNMFGSTLAPTYTAITTTTVQGKFPLKIAATLLATTAAIPAAETGSRIVSPAAASTAPAAAAPTPTAPVEVATPSGLDIGVNVLNGQNLVSVLTNRAAATFAQQRTPIRATVGVLGLATIKFATPVEGTVIQNLSIACALGDAEIRGNQMNDLTFGTLLVAGFASLRIQENNLTGGVAGFWMVLPSARNPQDVDAGEFFDTIENFEEFKLLTAFASLLSPPAAEAANELPAFTGEAAVFISGNHISTGPNLAATLPKGQPSEDASVGHNALLLWLATSNEAAAKGADLSAIVNNNRMVNFDTTAPTALLVLPQLQSCTVTGNIFVNRPALATVDTPAASLWVLMDNSLKIPDPIAITGNVLRGQSNTTRFVRPGATERAGWSSYNADPS
ncbi:DUF6519 domain-containing protein [Bradyrhizobium sp. McL0616]|uniref:DUF6519 domain-containing protein n=1 Tax=Bradyrhizobium sp. McL0616 TaxID=3415674 RepID=UPI003CF3F9D8